MEMQGFILDKTASQIFNILTEHSLELGDVFTPYKEIFICDGSHGLTEVIMCTILRPHCLLHNLGITLCVNTE
jgi:hypothetical protein